MKKIMLIVLLASSIFATENKLEWPQNLIKSDFPTACNTKTILLDYEKAIELEETEKQIDYLAYVFHSEKANNQLKTRILERLSLITISVEINNKIYLKPCLRRQ